MGEPPGAPAGDNRCSPEYGVTLNVMRVSVCSAARSGAGRTETAPVIIAPTYCASPPGSVLVKNRGLGVDEDSPLPLSRKTRAPSRLNIAAVGYHPVGMNPSTSLDPTFATSTTA